MSNLLQKRQKLHTSIRNQQKQEYIKKIRYQLIQNQINQIHKQLDNLILATQAQISKQQLKRLIQYVNQWNINNAIIHLGNLIIDHIIDPHILFQNKENQIFQLKPGDSQYWSWIIRVLLVDFNLCSDKLFDYCLSRISYGLSSDFILEHSLQSLKLMLRRQKYQVLKIILVNEKLMLKIKQYTLHVSRKVSQLCYEIIDDIIQYGDKQTHQFIQICGGQSQISRILLPGFHKSDPSQRKFPLIICRIINNIFSSGILINQLIKPCLNLTQNCKEHIKVELSYLWLSYMQNASDEYLLKIYNQNILNRFEELLAFQYEKQQNHQQVKQNVQSTINLLIQKGSTLGEKVYLELISRIKIFMFKFRQNNNKIIQTQTHTHIVSQTMQKNRSIIQQGMDLE